MRFSCENCQAKYQVADEKVAGKTIRMKCRKCGHSIEVKPMTGGESSAPPPGADGDEASASPETSLGGGQGARSIAATSFPEPRQGAPSRGPLDSQPGMDRAPESLRAALGATEASELPAHFWYVAIGGAPVGPIALAEVIAKARDGAIHERSLAWREGLAEWQPIANLPELLEALGPALQPAPVPRSAVGAPLNVPGPSGGRRSSRPPPSALASAPQPVPASPSLAPSAPAASKAGRDSRISNSSTLAATPISNELRAILDSSPSLEASPVVEAVAKTKSAESLRDEMAPPSRVLAAPKAAPGKGPLAVAAAVGVVLGFALGRLTAPAAAARGASPDGSPSGGALQAAPKAPGFGDDKTDDVPMPPPVDTAAPAPAVANAAAAVAPRAAPAAPAPRPLAPAAAAPAAPAAPPAADPRPATAAAPPPPPAPGPSFGGGGASLTEGQLAAVLAQRKIQLRRACWERIENREAAVKVQATVNIEGTGRVSSVDATGTDAAVTACIKQQIESWQFPATGAPTTATLPFSFISQ